ncbi:hypothetical protein [Streptomyces longispororuber]|uniref:hypothetical protein n=1 Tax=Streptomyces longispororuber TaxID=68230 RepID=UPI002109C857|nr:hypothetical protein [Streptomyces longispororuber]MCQ4210378.1 hypothetical protein [Streptomyces longispororuber]
MDRAHRHHRRLRGPHLARDHGLQPHHHGRRCDLAQQAAGRPALATYRATVPHGELDRTVTLRTAKRMGRLLDDAGRATGYVPVGP